MKSIALVTLALGLGAARMQDDEALQPVDGDFARAIGEKLAQEAAGFEKPRFKIDADSAKSVGLHVPDKLGLLVAPQKDLKEGETEGYAGETGKPLGYLFFYNMAPTVDGKAVDLARLHVVKFSNDEGKSFTIPTLLLSVRRVADDDWRLYAYGKEEKPIIDAKFSAGSGPGDKPVAVQVKDVDGRKDTLVVTLFDKYQAAIPLARLDK